MTGPAPGAWGGGHDPYARPDAYDPLTDPLPKAAPGPAAAEDPYPGHGGYDGYDPYGAGYAETSAAASYGGGYAAPGPYAEGAGYGQAPGPAPGPAPEPESPMPPEPFPAGQDPETVGLRRPDEDISAPAGPAPRPAGRHRAPSAEETPPAPPARTGRHRSGPAADAPEQPARPAPGGRRRARPQQQTTAAATGGRAARRKAATRRPGGGTGRRRAGAAPATPPPPPAPEAVSGGRAARRKAAKAAAKAARQTGTAISNVIGELFITTGALLLLFVVYQVWWTNVEARAHADGKREELQEQWEDGGGGGDGDNPAPGAFEPGDGFAILYMPTLDVAVPIAETVDEDSVLDNGMVGHYSEEDGLPTAMPWDETGNVGLAGHRNTHGEPFRYINTLEPGDPIVIETEDAYYTYEMTSRLDSTLPSNTAVLDPIPEQGGFTEPGRYVTLTTCTPEFTSTYRLIVWGELVEERPRSEGMPDALVT